MAYAIMQILKLRSIWKVQDIKIEKIIWLFITRESNILIELKELDFSGISNCKTAHLVLRIICSSGLQNFHDLISIVIQVYIFSRIRNEHCLVSCILNL